MTLARFAKAYSMVQPMSLTHFASRQRNTSDTQFYWIRVPQPSPRPMSKQLTVYVRKNCHLCADMIDTLAEFQQPLNFTFVVRDIDCDPRWSAKYNNLVPVLTRGDEEICHYFLDAVALRDALS